MTVEVLMILCLLFTKHFLADFPLQNEYMLRKNADEGWVLPLLTHTALHAVLTIFVLAFFIDWQLVFILGALDFAAHTCIDAWKARLARYPITTKAFWTSLGFNQWLHAITYLQIANLAS